MWVIHLDRDGCETARSPLADTTEKAELPLRAIVAEALKHDAVAITIVRHADTECRVTPADCQAIEQARHTLRPVGIRLHDYIVWHGDQCVSLRLTGRL